MKTLVAYLSQTGNTRKVAEAIYDVLPEDKEIKAMDELENLEGYDLVFFGFPILMMGPAKDAADFILEHATGKRIALFCTHGAPEGAERVKDWLDKSRETASGGEVVEMFDCQGEVALEVIGVLLKSEDPEFRRFGEEAKSAKGQPDETRLQRAREFAREVVENHQG